MDVIVLKLYKLISVVHGQDTAARMTNSADPDRTASKEQSVQGLHCLIRPVFAPIFQVNCGISYFYV